MRILQFLKNRYAPRGARTFFSQTGEDILMDAILQKIGIKNPLYIDIGAHHPYFGNNTYLFYTRGSNGVLVEPDPALADTLQKKRSRDIVVRAGASGQNSEIPFYIFPHSTRNTFSQVQAENWEKQSGEKPAIQHIPVLTLDSIIMKHCGGKTPDIVSIDAEGVDIDIISRFSWHVRPKIFCVETAESANVVPKRNQAIFDLMNAQDYILCAETPANSIFIDSKFK